MSWDEVRCVFFEGVLEWQLFVLMYAVFGGLGGQW